MKTFLPNTAFVENLNLSHKDSFFPSLLKFVKVVLKSVRTTPRQTDGSKIGIKKPTHLSFNVR